MLHFTDLKYSRFILLTGPSEVVNLSAKSISATSVTITWQPPPVKTDTYNIDLRLTNEYQCQLLENAQKIFYKSSTELSASVDNLTPYSTYEFYVSAVNELGESQEVSINVTTGEVGKCYILIMRNHKAPNRFFVIY